MFLSGSIIPLHLVLRQLKPINTGPCRFACKNAVFLWYKVSMAPEKIAYKRIYGLVFPRPCSLSSVYVFSDQAFNVSLHVLRVRQLLAVFSLFSGFFALKKGPFRALNLSPLWRHNLKNYNNYSVSFLSSSGGKSFMILLLPGHLCGDSPLLFFLRGRLFLFRTRRSAQ